VSSKSPSRAIAMIAPRAAMRRNQRAAEVSRSRRRNSVKSTRRKRMIQAREITSYAFNSLMRSNPIVKETAHAHRMAMSHVDAKRRRWGNRPLPVSPVPTTTPLSTIERLGADRSSTHHLVIQLFIALGTLFNLEVGGYPLPAPQSHRLPLVGRVEHLFH
jgi:hypothetical protein